MKVLVINLERAKDRKKIIQQQLKELNLYGEFIEAIDYKTTDRKIIDTFRTPFDERYYWLKDLTQGEIACFLSHRKAWQKLIDSKDEWALILEDDVKLNSNLTSLLANNNWIPKGITLILSSKKAKHHSDYCSVSGLILKNSNNISFGKIYDNTKTSGGASGYFLHRTAAKVLIEATKTTHMPVDDFLFSRISPARKQCTAYVMDKAIAIHPEENLSFLQTEKATVKTPFFKCPIKYLNRKLYKVKHKICTILFSKKLPIN